MMDRSLIGHGIFAALAAAAAFAAWSRPTTSGDEDASVVMVPGDPERLTKVEWEDEGWRVALDKAGSDWKIAVTELPKQQDPAAPVSAAAPAGAKAKVYPAAERAQEILKQLAPLQAARSLGMVADDKLAGLGLDAPASKLVLHYGDVQKVVEIGGSTFGSGDQYARVPGGEIFLLRASTLSSLKHGATSLVDRTALGTALEKVERITVTAGGKSRELVQRYADDKAKAHWADRAEPDVKLEQATAWIDRVLKLRIADLSEAAQPTNTPQLTVELYSGDTSLGLLSLWPPDDKVALARSSRFDLPVTVTKANAEAILRDADAILSEGK